MYMCACACACVRACVYIYVHIHHRINNSRSKAKTLLRDKHYYKILTIVVRIKRARGLFFLLEYKLILRRSVDYCLVTIRVQKKRDKRKVEYMCAGVDKRTYIRTSTRYARASCVPLTFHVRGTCERNAPELQKGLAPHKGNDMCRSI